MNHNLRDKQFTLTILGFSIVELMITLTILTLFLGSLWVIFDSQMRNSSSGTDIQLNDQNARQIFKLLENELLLVGYGQDEDLAFFIKDNTEIQGSWADLLYLSDWRFLGGDEIKSSWRQDGADNCTGGIANIISGSGTQTVTVDCLDLDDYELLGKHKLINPFKKEAFQKANNTWTSYNNCYGDNCTDNCQNNGAKICSSDELMGGIWQTIISDSTVQKVARIISISNKTLNLDQPLMGNKLVPAIYYCLDQGANQECDSNPNTSFILKRSDRSSGGRQPLASDIVDFQVAYEDWNNNWYCDGTGPCPMSPFRPRNIKTIRVTIISRQDASNDIGNVAKCNWKNPQQTGHMGPCTTIGNNSTSTCISAENGQPWGCDCGSETELKKTYYISTYTIHPWNTIMESLITR